MIRERALKAGVVLTLLLAAACGAQGDRPSATPPSTAVSNRPSSPAKISILSPRNGQTMHSHNLRVRLSLKKAHIVKPTTSHIDPHRGHIHVLLDGNIVSMNYGFEDTIHKLAPGTHTLRVEFVASDHLPFDPRVFQEVAFEVKA
jgi:hypothetical protein